MKSNESTSTSILKLPCSICQQTGNGMHFGAIACRACAAFFRRTVALKKLYICKNNGKCKINSTLRCLCRLCRYSKCLAVGMRKECVQSGVDGTYTNDPEDKSSNYEGPASSYQSVGTMPTLKLLQKNYNRLEEIRELVHHRKSENMFVKKVPKNITHKEANEVSVKEYDLIIDWVSSSYIGFNDLPSDQKEILMSNFFLPFSVIQSAYFGVQHGRSDVLIIASGDYVDYAEQAEFPSNEQDERLMSMEDSAKMFSTSFYEYRRAIIEPMIRDEIEEFEFLTLCTLVLFETGLEGQNEESTRLANSLRETIQRELIFYYRNIRHLENPSIRLANLICLLPVVHRISRRFREDIQVSHMFNGFMFSEKLFKMWTARF